MLSTHPTLVDDRVSPRHIDLRPFAINDGEEIWVLPGGLTVSRWARASWS